MNTYQERKRESTNIKEKYPNKIPCIIKPAKPLKLAKTKFLVPYDITIGNFIHIIRNRVNISHGDALFMFVENGTFPRSYASMGQIYSENANMDGFLYFTISLENTFGK